jgi:hypothetical protein
MSRNRGWLGALLLAAVVLTAPASSPLEIELPLEDQLSLAGEPLEVRIKLPPGATDLLVELDGSDVTALLTLTGNVATGTVAAAAGEHSLAASVRVDGQARDTERSFATIDLLKPDVCEVLNDTQCLLPYPSSRFLATAPPDPGAPCTGTGLQLDIPLAAFAEDFSEFEDVFGIPLDPAPFNELDGFSPTAQILMNFPSGVDLAASNAARLQPRGCCGQPPGPPDNPWIDTRTQTGRSLDPDSPTVLIDADTGERVLHFVELDARAFQCADGRACREGLSCTDGSSCTAKVERQTFFLRPAEGLKPAQRYIVAVRNLVDAAGTPVAAEETFAALRDQRPTTIPTLESRKPYFEQDVFAPLAAAGVARQELILAFDFTTQSDCQLTGQMLAMRDQGFAWLAAQSGPTFSVETVEAFDCNAPNAIFERIVAGTFESPFFLDGDLADDGVQFMNVDANDVPVQNGTTSANFHIGIPCSAFDEDPQAEPARPMIFGHGALLSGEFSIESINDGFFGDVGDSFDYLAGATDFRGFSALDTNWLASQVFSQLNNFAALPDRQRQGVVNTLILTRMMKQGVFNSHACFEKIASLPPGQLPVCQPGGTCSHDPAQTCTDTTECHPCLTASRDPELPGFFPGASEEAYYYGISFGGVMGLFLAALTPDVERFAVAVPGINWSLIPQRSVEFGLFELLLFFAGFSEPMDAALLLGGAHELWVAAEPAGYARHITSDPLPGSGSPARILMTVAWLDKRLSNQASEIAARTLELPNLSGSIQQGLQGIPDVSGPQDSALVIWDTGVFDLASPDPTQQAAIPPLANLTPSQQDVRDPHLCTHPIPAAFEQMRRFLRPGGQVENLCDGPLALCDAGSPAERPDPSFFFLSPDECAPFPTPEPMTIPVTLDIKSGSCPNAYNREGRGVLPVAVVGTSDFDVLQIDPASVVISRADGMGDSVAPHEGPPGPHTVVADVATPFAGESCDCHALQGDGLPDLALKFKTIDLVAALQLDELPSGDLPELVVSGTLLDGTPFEGSDCVRLVPPGTPPNLLAVQSNVADAWIDVGPLDDQLDTGGFADFERTYPAGTEAVLTAAPAQDGLVFRGWRGDDGRLVPGTTFGLVVDGHIQTLEAVYDAPQRRCGLGYELVLVVAPLRWLRRRRKFRTEGLQARRNVPTA